ncbi:hypothetical protein Pcinc_027459 [Petrolisthes cinctipes]|uniref:Uncharacterized protein n=1 Tax=Petrolisthes cinctipes TaxID=88211 RepID=A0AAE1F419_PETCI|nr:hypothetical protein Pcinc_027459 [Petrolisthes cinctipes]
MKAVQGLEPTPNSRRIGRGYLLPRGASQCHEGEEGFACSLPPCRHPFPPIITILSPLPPITTTLSPLPPITTTLSPLPPSSHSSPLPSTTTQKTPPLFSTSLPPFSRPPSHNHHPVVPFPSPHFFRSL